MGTSLKSIDQVRKALTIAGSDPSGGAGIQADLKTFSSLKVYGMAVIAALTAQNTRGVSAVSEIPPDFLAQQLDAVLSDLPPDAAKTGMLMNTATVEVVAQTFVAADAKQAILKIATQLIGELFFQLGGEGDAFDFPAPVLVSAFGQLHADPGSVDASALEFGQAQEAVEFVFLFGKGFVGKFDAEAVPDDVADFFADVDDGEVVFAANVEAEDKRIWAAFEVSEVFEAIVGLGFGDEIEAEEGGGGVARLAAIFLEPLFFIEAFALEAGDELGAGVGV